MTYWIQFGQLDDPFRIDPILRNALEEKYGKGPTTTLGISREGIDMDAASRKTIWDLARHTIELQASSYPTGRNLFLTYEAKTAAAKAHKKQEENASDE